MGLDRSISAVLAAVVLLAVAGCGGSSSDATTTATATSPAKSAKPATLDQSQRDRIDRAVQSLDSSTARYLSALNRCVPSKRRKRCVRSAVTPAEAAVRRTRRTLTTLRTTVAGSCATALTAVRDKLTDLTQVLGPMAEAMQRGDFAQTTRLGANAQLELRTYAATSRSAQQVCGS